MVKPFISPRVCGKVKEKKKRPDQFCELKNILRPTTTTRRKKKKKGSQRLFERIKSRCYWYRWQTKSYFITEFRFIIRP